MSNAASGNFAVTGTQVLDQRGVDVIISVGWTRAGQKGRAGRGRAGQGWSTFYNPMQMMSEPSE